jgi:hypothetical protein
VAGSDDMPGREDGAAADVFLLYDVVDGDHKGKLVFSEKIFKNTVKLSYIKLGNYELPFIMNKLFSPKSMHNTINYPGYNELLVITNKFCRPKLFVITEFHCTVKFEYDGQPWDLTKVAVVQKWLLYRGWSLKIAL